MKRIFIASSFFALAFLGFNCQKEFSLYNGEGGTASNVASPIKATLQGNVLDESGQPAAGVSISAGAVVTVTDANGYFRITDAVLDKNTSLVTASRPGYFKAYRTFRATSGVNQVVIQLNKKALAGTINSITGGEVTMANGAKILLAANGIITAGGAGYSGDVKVYAAYIDPTSADIGKSVPGSFMADDADNKRVVLQSFGMLAVELIAASGEKLQVAPGSNATLTTPIPSSILQKAPASISLWYVDETTGIWKEEGTAQKNGNSYVGTVKHFSYWNCDIGLPAVNFTAIFKTADGEPLKNISTRISFIADTSTSFAYGYTDSIGWVSGLVPSGKNLVLEVMDDCYNIVYSKNIGSLSQNTNLGTIIIPASISSMVTVKGILMSCSHKAVANGYVAISNDNIMYYANTNANGEFTTSFFNCSTTVGKNLKLVGIDPANLQQSTVIEKPMSSPVTNVGNIDACGIAAEEYISYTLDSKNYNFVGQPVDSITVTSNLSNSFYSTYMEGYRDSVAGRIGILISSLPQPGKYPFEYFSVNGYTRIQMPGTIKVTVTAFPQNTGDFFEGNFSGTFRDSSAINVLHNISCTFKVRKDY